MFHVEQSDLLEKILVEEFDQQDRKILDRFSLFHDHLVTWNRKTNLISKNDEKRIVARHMLESLGLARVLDMPLHCTVIDLGSGAGFPGIPLKIIRPDLQMVLVESKRKKVSFLQSVIHVLDLDGIRVELGRIEDLRDSISPVRFVLSRAVADICTLVRWSYPLIAETSGCLVAFKGSEVGAEIAEFEKEASRLGIRTFRQVPFNPFPVLFPLHNRHLVFVE
jgi:16S rRNA (guanine527-N7)-methyltransferase